VYDVDGFSVPPSTIAALKAGGKKVVCYFSFGTFESYRPDSDSFPKRVKKGRVCQDRWCRKWWPGERWLNVKDPVVKQIMEKRVQLAASKGCDGIEPDNIDAYSNRLNVWLPPFSRSVRISKNDQIRYNAWIADTVHRHGMSVGLKNALTIAGALVGKYDWALVEECNAFSDWSGGEWYKGKYECDYANVFIKANKAVFVAEYTSAWGTTAGRANSIQFPQRMCADNNAHGFSTRLHDLDLGPTKFPWADCLQHQPAGCAAAAWQVCMQAGVSPLSLSLGLSPRRTRSPVFRPSLPSSRVVAPAAMSARAAITARAVNSAAPRAMSASPALSGMGSRCTVTASACCRPRRCLPAAPARRSLSLREAVIVAVHPHENGRSMPLGTGRSGKAAQFPARIAGITEAHCLSTSASSYSQAGALSGGERCRTVRVRAENTETGGGSGGGGMGGGEGGKGGGGGGGGGGDGNGVNKNSLLALTGPPPAGSEGGHVHAAQPAGRPLLPGACLWGGRGHWGHIPCARYALKAVKAGTSMLLNLLGDLFCQVRACGEGGHVHAAQPAGRPLLPGACLWGGRGHWGHIPCARYALKAVKAGTSMLLNLLGDLFCQLVVEGGHGVDARRAATISLLGLLLVGPTLHVWYSLLFRVVSVQGTPGTLIRLALDQLLFSPLFIATFFSSLLTLEGRPSAIPDVLKQEWAKAVVANWKVWIPFQFLNFRFVPLHLQVAASNVIALLWNVYLSFASHRGVKEM
ncbi:unnamed protein product, partial [Closterium sp. Naga37s-1]